MLGTTDEIAYRPPRPNSDDNGKVPMVDQHIDYIELSGEPRSRGQAYGEGLRDKIVERDRVWRHQIETACNMPADRFIERFLAETRFVPAIERWTPDLLEEVRGISEGSGLPNTAVLAAQFMDEEWWYQLGMTEAPHCSSLGGQATGGGTIIGQTMDLPVWMNGFQTLLLIRDVASETDAYVVTVAGMIGLMGVNSRGLGVCVNTLLQLNHSPAGLPVAFVTRGLLGRSDVRGAVEFLTSVSHASGQNYVLGDPHEVIDFECSAGAAVPYRRDPAGGVVWHTNHPFVNGDRKSGLVGPIWESNQRSSDCRLRSLDNRLTQPRPFDAALAREVLGARDDPRYPVSKVSRPGESDRPGSFFTFAAMIAELGDQPRLEVAAGAPSDHEFACYSFGGRAASLAAAQ
ncbi:MAG: C45 family autoproteolytic acyltransferase/hydrolase [Dongiaceae bacterium]